VLLAHCKFIPANDLESSKTNKLCYAAIMGNDEQIPLIFDES
jgi:hypothetical protein